MIPLLRDLREAWEFGRTREKLHWISGQNVTWEEFLGHVGVGLNSLYTSRSKGLRWVEQTPQYALHLDAMKLLFPDARFLFMVRDGRDVVHSLRNFVKPVEHDRASRIWRDFIGAGLAFSSGPGGESLLLVSYAEAVTNTETELRRVFEFLDEPFAAESVEFIRSKEPINSSFPGQGPGGPPRWQEWTEEERVEFDEIAGDLLIELGFEPDHGWAESRVGA